MKHIVTIVFILFFLIACNGQTKNFDYSKTIKEQAEMMGQLLLKKDFISFSKYTYPKILEMMGGKQKMVEVLDKGLKEMQSEGVAFLKVTFGEPSKIITIGNELQCTVPQTIEIKVPKGKLKANSTLIAISIDNGKNWYFIDTSGKDIQTMKKRLPNLSEELVIPETKQPTFYTE
ncbi:MAG: hypothetical protein LW842_10010 [Sphingobacteriales bacterium]|nr:hypothetical protein [Sphingobacteriales bacterium]